MPTSSSSRWKTCCVPSWPNARWTCASWTWATCRKWGGDKVKQVIKVRNGIETEQAKKITKAIKDSKLKVQASIQGDAVRVNGAKRDDLQAAMALLRKEISDLPISFNNFRD